VPIPPLSTQQRIASILGAYDDLIENNRRRIAILEEMARRLFDEWFVQLRFPGHESKKLIDTSHGPLPSSWRWVTLGELCRECRDSVLPSEIPSNTPYVGLEHIPRRSITLDNFRSPDKVTSLKLRFHRGDILFGKIRPYFHKVVIAPFDGVASSDAIIIRALTEHVRGLVLTVTSSDAFVAHSVQTSNGTKMPRANWGVLTNYHIPLPPAALLETFNRFVLDVAYAAMAHQAANERLAMSRDLLLPCLVSGELPIAAAQRVLEAAD
jgi:type I restriction enzyme S subunit